MTSLTTPAPQHHSPRLNGMARKVGALVAAVAVVAAGALGLFRLTGLGQASSATAAPYAMPLAKRVLSPGQMPGYLVTQRPAVIRNSTRWAAGVEQAPSVVREAKRLRGLGFVAGIDEQLHGRYPLQSEAISIVEQYRSAASAGAEFRHQSAQIVVGAHGAVTHFPVLGVPGAMATETRDSSGTSVNIAFADGRFYYLVGAFRSGPGSAASLRDEMVRGAQTTYLMVHGCVADSTAPVA